MSTSVAYLRKRLTDIGRQDLLDAAERGEISTFAAAEEAGLVRRQAVLGTGSENAAKRRAWAIMKATRQTPPLAPKPGPTPASTPAHSKFSQETPRNGRSAPTTPIDLAAAIREWEEAQKPAPSRDHEVKLSNRLDNSNAQREGAPPRDEGLFASSIVEANVAKAEREGPERTPFPAHAAIPCTSCRHPQAAAALREVLDVYVAACRGEPHQTGSTIPRACCQWSLRRPDIRALIA
jgi:hypothetical protein